MEFRSEIGKRMEEQTHNGSWISLTAVVAALGASLCCILPVAVAVLGVGSAALGAFLEPFRPYLIGLTFAFLGFAYYQAYKPVKAECAPGQACAISENRHTQRILLWIVTVAAAALITFPYYAGWILLKQEEGTNDEIFSACHFSGCSRPGYLGPLGRLLDRLFE